MSKKLFVFMVIPMVGLLGVILSQLKSPNWWVPATVLLIAGAARLKFLKTRAISQEENQ